MLVTTVQGCKTAKIPEVKNDDITTIKLIQVNDVYEIAPLSGGQYGGMARVAHISDSIKKQFPNSYLVMAGDFLNPSLLGTLKVDGKRVKGKQMIEVMNAMEFDLATFGNHEFDLKESELQERLNESDFEWVSANVFQKKGDNIKSFYRVKNGDSIRIPETIFYDIEIGEEYPLRLGFYSVTVDSNPVDYVYYADYSLEARSAYTSLQQSKSDIIIGLTHLAIEEDILVAEDLLETDLIMGGHEHVNMMVPAGNTFVAKADANAKTIYVHTLTYNKKTEQITRTSQLVDINDKVPSLPRVKAIVDKWENILNTEIKQVIDNPDEIIYTTKVPLDATDKTGRSTQSNLGAFFTEAMAKGFDAPTELAFVNGGSFRLDDKLEGDVTSIDIFRVLPFGGNVQRVEMTGALLKEILSYGESRAGTGAYLQRYNLSKSENGDWLALSKPIENTKIYTVALSDFLLKGFDIPFLTEKNPGVKSVYIPKATEPASDIRKAIIEYMKTL
ncbi:hypothetical protein ULMS_22420 [Patiriisocius marinistellae]|uniref:Bifunctional metallophosphatase/5'-nucleotidase n=1 Tax=Patiriisocius marinistellae TaxID=2494560 RepID=A0A5J4FZU7_9FLAO|nr:hypothetical protein ULMS_22420 [Patiriisocius marinistellae]